MTFQYLEQSNPGHPALEKKMKTQKNTIKSEHSDTQDVLWHRISLRKYRPLGSDQLIFMGGKPFLRKKYFRSDYHQNRILLWDV